MTFTYSKPSLAEMEQMDVIEITNEISWHPVLHSDDSQAIRTMNENSAFTTKQDPPAALAANMWSIHFLCPTLCRTLLSSRERM
jgi:hypothetical protein